MVKFSNILKFGKILLWVMIGLLIFLNSGHFLTSFFPESEKIKFFTYILLSIFLLLLLMFKLDYKKIVSYFSEKRYKSPSTLLIFFFILLVSSVVSFAFNQEKIYNLNTYISFWAILLFSFIIVAIIPFDSFVKHFTKTVKWIAILSSFIFLTTLLFNTPLSNSVVITVNNRVYGNYFLLYFDYYEMFYNSLMSKRLMGPFWEPGVMASVLLFAFLLEGFYKKKHSLVNLFVFSFTIFLTKSSAGIIILLILLIAYVARYIKNKKTDYIFVFSFLGLLILFFIFSRYLLPYLSELFPSIFLKFYSKSVSFYTRILSPYYFMMVFLKNPLFGRGGYTAYNEYMSIVPTEFIDSGTSTFGYLLASFGIFAIVYALIPLVIVNQRKTSSALEKIMLLIAFIFILNKENHTNILSTMIILLYLLGNSGRKFKPELLISDTSENTTIFNKLRGNNDENVLFRDLFFSVVVKGAALAIGLFLIPMYSSYFDNDDIMGSWLVIISVLTWILTFDIGLGNGMKNKLILALERKDQKSVKEMITTTYISTGFISLLFLIVGSFVINFADVNKIMGIPSYLIPAKTLKIAMFIVLFTICSEFVLKTVIYIIQSFQKNSIASSLMLISNVMLVFFLILAPSIESDSKLIVVSIVYFFSISLPLLTATIMVFRKKLSYALPNFSSFNIAVTKQVMSLGLLFFIIQIADLLLLSANSLLFSRLFNPEVVVIYTKYYKLFAFIIGIWGTVVQMPIWSAVTKAVANGNISRINKIRKTLNIAALLTVLVIVAVSLSLQFIFDVWLGQYSIQVVFWPLFSLTLYSTITIFTGISKTINSGLSALKSQVIVTFVAVVLKYIIILLIIKLNLFTLEWHHIVMIDAVLISPLILFGTLETRKTLKNLSLQRRIKNETN